MRSNQQSSPTIPPGRRIYAIGDVHGEGDLLRQALRLIDADNATRRDASVTLVFLGDIIDRGPDAADLLRTFARLNCADVVVLKGNHEAALADAYRGDQDVLSEWLPFGGVATLNGFGITPEQVEAAPAALAVALRASIEWDLVEWIDGLPRAWECGDYYFTHAGIRPGVKLHKQDERDLLWIREPFLSSSRWHGKVIVHGHTIEPGLPALGGNRIGVDTGAHEHGVLTVLGLEGGRQWLLQAFADQPQRDANADPAHVETSPAADAPVPHAEASTGDIAALIASIITPTPPPPDATLHLKMPSDTVLGLTSPLPRPKGLGNRGVAAAGFALVVAALGGAVVLGTRPSSVGTGGVSIPIPDFFGTGAASPPAVIPTPTTRYPVKNRNRVRAARSGTVLTSEEAGVSSGEGPSPTLNGAALERALEEDRITTRRLNEEELARQRSLPSPPR